MLAECTFLAGFGVVLVHHFPLLFLHFSGWFPIVPLPVLLRILTGPIVALLGNRFAVLADTAAANFHSCTAVLPVPVAVGFVLLLHLLRHSLLVQ